MSYYSSVDLGDEPFYEQDAPVEEEQFVDVASHGVEPWVRIIIGNHTNPSYHVDDVRRIIKGLEEAVSYIERYVL